MRFAVAASALTMAASVMAAPWKPLGGDLAYVGPIFNATFKAGDTIPLEYTFYSGKTVNLNNTTNATAPAAPIITATLTSLAWVGKTGNQTLEVTLDNGRNTGLSKPCLSTDLCTGNYYPKRVNLVIPADVYPSSYNVTIGYVLSAVNKTIWYNQPITVVAATANVTSPAAINADAPSVTVTLPVFAAPSSALATQVPKAVVGLAVLVASMMML
ncbi:hypothetical protein BGZ74_002754 [Mortierella antarctica]|nr:hypothetical protein BGZ74_002754 [Mortierella antarctica]KAG0349803.1 hypothetical protein BG005_010655 [Podila minutissima]